MTNFRSKTQRLLLVFTVIAVSACNNSIGGDSTNNNNPNPTPKPPVPPKIKDNIVSINDGVKSILLNEGETNNTKITLSLNPDEIKNDEIGTIYHVIVHAVDQHHIEINSNEISFNTVDLIKGKHEVDTIAVTTHNQPYVGKIQFVVNEILQQPQIDFYLAKRTFKFTSDYTITSKQLDNIMVLKYDSDLGEDDNPQLFAVALESDHLVKITQPVDNICKFNENDECQIHYDLQNEQKMSPVPVLSSFIRIKNSPLLHNINDSHLLSQIYHCYEYDQLYFVTNDRRDSIVEFAKKNDVITENMMYCSKTMKAIDVHLSTKNPFDVTNNVNHPLLDEYLHLSDTLLHLEPNKIITFTATVLKSLDTACINFYLPDMCGWIQIYAYSFDDMVFADKTVADRGTLGAKVSFNDNIVKMAPGSYVDNTIIIAEQFLVLPTTIQIQSDCPAVKVAPKNFVYTDYMHDFNGSFKIIADSNAQKGTICHITFQKSDEYLPFNTPVGHTTVTVNIT